MVQIHGATTTASIQKLTLDTTPLKVFLYQKTPTALVGIDLNKIPGVYTLKAVLRNGQTLSKTITIDARTKPLMTLGIPESLGGNSTTSEDAMVATLNSENKTLAHLRTNSKPLWIEKFMPPLTNIFVTNPYGYTRQTGAYQIPHKGVDYRAAIGTPVTVINSGIVRLVANYRDYGKMVVVDHGLGVMSFYLHLSEINVSEGQVVQRGQIIGLSGDTGYAEGPHLHLSIRINGVSVDPVTFLKLFQ